MPGVSDFIFNRDQKAVYDGTEPGAHPGYLIPVPAHDEMTAPKNEWESRYLVGGKPVKTVRSQIETQQKDAARDNYQPKFNAYVVSYVKNNQKIPVEDKIAMYIHIDNHSRTKTVAPTTEPAVFKSNTNVSLAIEMFYKDSEAATGHAKPHKEDVCQMYIFIIEKDKDGNNILPTTKADYWFAGDSSDYHINLGFDIKDGGKEVYILPRWSNPEGNGDFGKQVILTIPR